METMIPKLFILTAEASIVLLLILIIVFIFSTKAKRKDIKAANELIRNYVKNKEERINSIKSQLAKIGFSGDAAAQAEKLYDQEKNLVKEFVTLYLKRDTYRLLEYSETITDVDDSFLKVSGSADTSTDEPVSEISATEENANATIMAREQAELNEAHLKELSELRLKNTELNEHLFEALETVTSLMTEHGKKTGQEVESNAQEILEAIIYLRDKRLGKQPDPSSQAPSADDGHDQVDDAWSINLEDDAATLDDSSGVDLGISDELNTDLDTLDEASTSEPVPETVESASEASTDDNNKDNSEDDDPWAAALSEQAEAEATSDTTVTTEENIPTVSEEADPWADALAEQANAEAGAETTTVEDSTSEAQAENEEEDPWSAALAEQAATEAEASPAEEEDDPWAAALAEQEKADKK